MGLYAAEIPNINPARLSFGVMQPSNPNSIQSPSTHSSDISCDSDYSVNTNYQRPVHADYGTGENTNLDVSDNIHTFVKNFTDM